jgi:hypothetical protein
MSNDLHDTTNPNSGAEQSLPEAVRDKLPSHLRDADLQMADDAMSATVQDSDTETVPLVDEGEGEVYLVTLKDVAWAKKNDLFSDSLKQTVDGQGKLDFAQYYREVAQAKIVEVEPEPENLRLWLQGLSAEMGSQLERHLPEPVDDLEDTREEN